MKLFLLLVSMMQMTYTYRTILLTSHLLKLSSRLLMSSTSTSNVKNTIPESLNKMPITVLSGFLGSGKTSFLTKLLDSNTNKGKRFGLVVNDMATVNVDAKSIRQQSIEMGQGDGIDTMELQNGCVCCTLAEDLMASVSKLVSISEMKGVPYDHIIVECSGIAEPRKIRDLFQEAEDYGSRIINRIKLDTLITVVDATVFLKLFGSTDDVKNNAELVTSPDKYNELSRDGSGERKITELLLEQVECADIVMINKCDLLADPDDLSIVSKVIDSMNPTAKVLSCIRGNVSDPLSIVGSMNGEGMATWGILDEHRNLVTKVQGTMDQAAVVVEEVHHHEHHHDHHEEEHHAVPSTDAAQSVLTDCDATCTDPTHHHDHSHQHHESNLHCEPTCNDPTHNHDHSHHHHGEESEATTAEKRFGITSFVYKRRRPFHPIRFTTFLQQLGKLSVTGISELSHSVPSPVDTASSSPSVSRVQKALLRSKGFVWIATSGAAAYFVSHAGQYLELVVMGRWWADIPENEWPNGLEEEIRLDFDGPHGDRRQELVFIGQFGEEKINSYRAFEELLDACLLTEDEMKEYEALYQKGDYALREKFVPDLASI